MACKNMLGFPILRRKKRALRFSVVIWAAPLLFLLATISPCFSAEISVCSGQGRFAQDSFGTWSDEPNPIEVYTLRNTHGLQVRILNLGGVIQSLCVLDREGRLDDVVLGFDRFEPYFKNGPYFGSIIGRYAKGIADERLTLDRTPYTLLGDDGRHTPDGGTNGFDLAVWKAEAWKKKKEVALSLSYRSQDGEQSLAGNFDAQVTYTLNDSDELIIDYIATTDNTAVVNLTSHSYFNLAGQGNGDILGHELQINATRFTPVDKNMIPTGELRSVRETPLDFTKSTPIGARMNEKYEQLLLANGYDHNFVIDRKGSGLVLAARLHEPSTGRVLEIYTTEPAVQLDSANWLDGTLPGKKGRTYRKHYGLAFETERIPDSPNHPSSRSTTLRRGATYQSRTVYRFSTDRR